MNMKLQSVHHISRALEPGVAATKDSPGVRPKMQEIQPLTVFSCPSEEGDEYLSMGAAILPDGKARYDLTIGHGDTPAALPKAAPGDGPSGSGDKTGSGANAGPVAPKTKTTGEGKGANTTPDKSKDTTGLV